MPSFHVVFNRPTSPRKAIAVVQFTADWLVKGHVEGFRRVVSEWAQLIGEKGLAHVVLNGGSLTEISFQWPETLDYLPDVTRPSVVVSYRHLSDYGGNPKALAAALLIFSESPELDHLPTNKEVRAHYPDLAAGDFQFFEADASTLEL